MKKSNNFALPQKAITPIIKVVGDYCNLRCWYCFYNARDQSTPCVMSDELLEKFIREYMELFSGNLKFIWHGGEPLLAGLPFFKKIINLQTKYLKNGQKIQNNIQTNGVLIDVNWAKFFKEYDFKVGISLDGAKESHNRFRKNGNNAGSFDSVTRGIKILRDHGVKLGIIQTVTRDNIVRAKKDFDFFSNALGVHGWGINIFLDIAKINKAMKHQSVSNKDLIAFLETYIDLWLGKNDCNLKIREIENFAAGVFGKTAFNCSFNGSCARFFCLDYDGKIYPCDRFSHNPEFSFGDLNRESFSGILNGFQRIKYAKDVISLHPDCAVCEWKNACHNGCAANRIGGIRGKYYYCETRKTIFSYLREKIKALNFSEKEVNIYA